MGNTLIWCSLPVEIVLSPELLALPTPDRSLVLTSVCLKEPNIYLRSNSETHCGELSEVKLVPVS